MKDSRFNIIKKGLGKPYFEDDNFILYNKDCVTSFNLNWERFGDYINQKLMGIGDKTKTTIREDYDPSRFMEVVVNSVQKERERMQQIREKRSSVRDDLVRKLFGGRG